MIRPQPIHVHVYTATYDNCSRYSMFPVVMFSFPTQSPRYDSLKSLLSSHLRHFLTLTPSQATPTSQDEPIAPKRDVLWRMCELERYLDGLPRNTEDRRQLLECGYSNRLWEEVGSSLYSITACSKCNFMHVSHFIHLPTSPSGRLPECANRRLS